MGLISVIESLVGIRRKEWVAPCVLAILVIGAMPIVTHFMATGQAARDLGAENGTSSSLPTAVFTPLEPSAKGGVWDKVCEQSKEGESACNWPPLRVVLMNNGIAYVFKDTEKEAEGTLYTVKLKDVDTITYIRPTPIPPTPTPSPTKPKPK